MAGGYGTAPGHDIDRGSGWLTFAGVMLALLGTMNVVYGIAAISESRFYTRDADYLISDLNGLGWALLVIGVVQFFAVLSIWGGTEWGRWVGVLTAAVNSIVQLIFLPAHPFGALAVFSIDIVVMYGLLAYGGRQGPATG